MRLGNQAMGALMMALQKSLLEQSDIVPMLQEMDFQIDPSDSSKIHLMVTNPPVVELNSITLAEAAEDLDSELDA
jgi:hypothetical protein